MEKKITLANNRILAKIVAKNETESGLVLPSDDKSENQEAIIVKKYFFEKEEDFLEEGDTVYYVKYSGDALKIGDEEYLVLNEKDILCYTRKKIKNI